MLSNRIFENHSDIANRESLLVMVVAGEPSSDMHAASFVKGLRSLCPTADVFGMGGSHCRAVGVDTVVDSEESASVMGIIEIAGSLKKILAAYKLLLNEARNRKPDLVVLVDYPDFNLRLAKDLHALGLKVFYFISPQLWAWRSGRVKTMQKYVSRVATIFPFEVSFYQKHGVDAKFVGHPFLDRYTDEQDSAFDRNTFLSSIGCDPNKPVVGMLPGSRKSEIERLLEPLLNGFKLLSESCPDVQGVIPVAPGLDIAKIETAVSSYDRVRVVVGQASEVLRASNASVVASGTATIEAALANRPFLVVYKLSPITYMFGRLLVRGVKYFAMANLVAGKKIVEELLQNEVTPLRIANELRRMLTDDDYVSGMRKDLLLVRKNLEVADANKESVGERAASYALGLLNCCNR